MACVLCDGNIIEAENIALIGEHACKVSTKYEQKTLRDHNIEIITCFLRENDHDVQEVARLLDIGKSSIYTMIKNGEIQIEKKCR